jgi:hypothetical protein
MPCVWEKTGVATIKRTASASTGNRKPFWDMILVNIVPSCLNVFAKGEKQRWMSLGINVYQKGKALSIGPWSNSNRGARETGGLRAKQRTFLLSGPNNLLGR